MKIQLTSFGEGHNPDELSALLNEIELLVMRAGYAHVYVAGETEAAYLQPADDEAHPRSKWKREWAAGTTTLPYYEWHAEDCRQTCGKQEDDGLTGDYPDVEQALSYLFGAYVDEGVKTSDELMVYPEWQAALFKSVGLSLPEGAEDRARSLATVLAKAFGKSNGFSEDATAAALAKASQVAAMRQLRKEHRQYTEGTLNALGFLPWFATIRAAGSDLIPSNAI